MFDGIINEEFIIEKREDYEEDDNSHSSENEESSEDSEVEINTSLHNKDNHDDKDNDGKGNGNNGGFSNNSGSYYNNKGSNLNSANDDNNQTNKSKSKKINYPKNNKKKSFLNFSMINPFRIKRNYNSMIEEEKKLFPNADIYGPNNNTKKKMKLNNLK